MRISDWSSDVCSSDLSVSCRTSKDSRDDSAPNSLVVRADVDTKLLLSARKALASCEKPSRGVMSQRKAMDARPLSSFSSPDAMNAVRSEEHTSELQSLMRISYAVFCLKKKNKQPHKDKNTRSNKLT